MERSCLLVESKKMAAHRAGIQTLILPSKNRKDLPEIPDYIQQDLRIIFVKMLEMFLKLLEYRDAIEYLKRIESLSVNDNQNIAPENLIANRGEIAYE